MMLTGTVPRRCVNLPPGALRLLLHTAAAGKLREGAAVDEFAARFGQWLGVPHVFGVSSGRSAFQLTLESLDLERGKEIIFPAFTFPVIPMVARLLGYKPVFCDVDPESFNAGAEHIEAKITENTGAVLATHMFGRPCPIREIAELVKSRGIRLLEDCAHACGVRVNSRPAGTFGDVGIYSFAEGKNMPCFGGAIATADEQIARRARSILDRSPLAEAGAIASQAFSIWVKWLLTRPFIFGITAYPVLRARLAMGKPLMDSTVGDALLDEFSASKPRIGRMTNLQAALGLLQLRYIDAFNDGARENARILTENLGEVPSVRVPRGSMDDHVYVYYPLSVDPEKRDDLRRFLLRHGVDSKNTDMSDCTKLRAFQDGGELSPEPGARLDASVLEICVYPIIPKREMKRIARLIRSWAGLPEIHLGGGRS